MHARAIDIVAITLYIYPMKKPFLAALVLCFCVFPLAAQGYNNDPQDDRFFWFLSGSILFFPHNNNQNAGVLESGPMPILPSPGAGLSFSLVDIFRLELTMDIYRTLYAYSDNLGRPVPVELENRSAQVISPLIGLQGAAFFHLRPDITARVFGGLAFDLRMVLLAPNLREDVDPMDEIRREVEAIRRYFWSSGRWLTPVLGVGADYTLNSQFRLGIDLRTWMPIYRLWTNENLPAIEGWRFGAGLRLTIQ